MNIIGSIIPLCLSIVPTFPLEIANTVPIKNKNNKSRIFSLLLFLLYLKELKAPKNPNIHKKIHTI